MEQLARTRLHSIELDIGKSCQIVRNGQLEVAGHQWRTISNGDSAMQPVADISGSGLQIVDVGNDTSCLFNKDATVFSRFCTPCCAFEEPDPQSVFKQHHPATER